MASLKEILAMRELGSLAPPPKVADRAWFIAKIARDQCNGEYFEIIRQLWHAEVNPRSPAAMLLLAKAVAEHGDGIVVLDHVPCQVRIYCEPQEDRK